MEEVYLLQDNASAHVSEKTMDFLGNKAIETMNHPPNSPDLNPIEQIWALLKHKIEQKNPRTKEQLRDAAM